MLKEKNGIKLIYIALKGIIENLNNIHTEYIKNPVYHKKVSEHFFKSRIKVFSERINLITEGLEDDIVMNSSEFRILRHWNGGDLAQAFDASYEWSKYADDLDIYIGVLGNTSSIMSALYDYKEAFYYDKENIFYWVKKLEAKTGNTKEYLNLLEGL